jgi:hypothetical protein
MTTCATCKRESGIEYAFCSNCGSQLRKISKPLSHNSSQDSCVKKGFATYGVLPHSIAVTKHKHTGGFLLKPPPRRIESAIPLVKLRTSNFSDNKDNNSRDGGDSSTISQVTSLNSKETIQKRMNSNPIRDSFLPGIMMAIDQHFLRENESSKVILQREKFMEQQITLAHTYRLQNSASIDRADNEALKFDREDSTSRSNSPASLSNRREISTSRSTSPAKTVRPRPGTVGQDSRDIGDVSHYMNDVGSVGTLYKQYIKRERILSGLTVASLDTLSIPLSASGGYEISDLFNSLDQKRDLYDLCGPHISSKKDNNNSSIVENTKVNTAVNLKLNRDDHDDDDKRHIGEDLPREAEVRPYSPSSAAALPWFCGIEENKEENKEDIDNENNEINKIFAINPEEKVDICGDIEVKPEVREESKKEVEKTEKDSHLERYRSRKESSESYHSYSVIARLFKTSCTAIDHALIQSEVSFTIDYSPKDLFDRQMIIKGALLAGNPYPNHDPNKDHEYNPNHNHNSETNHNPTRKPNLTLTLTQTLTRNHNPRGE